MVFDPRIPYNDLPPLPPRVEVETKAVVKKVAAVGRSLAELKSLGAMILNQSILDSSAGGHVKRGVGEMNTLHARRE
jgi:hypothetical protein